MIPRFSLYRELNQWDGDIQEDTNGRWVRWNDVSGYVVYALEHGFVATPVVAPDVPTMAMVEEPTEGTDAYLEEGIPFDEDDEDDLYEIVTNTRKPLVDTDFDEQ